MQLFIKFFKGLIYSINAIFLQITRGIKNCISLYKYGNTVKNIKRLPRWMILEIFSCKKLMKFTFLFMVSPLNMTLLHRLI